MKNTSSKRVGEERRPAFIHVSRLHSIKTRIVFFSVVATVLPAITLGSLAYLQITKFLNQKISRDLKNVTTQVSRELDLSIKERIYDVRVFSSSYIVTENLAKILHGTRGQVEKSAALNVIQTYLQSVRDKFVDYTELLIMDMQNHVLATSSKTATAMKMPADWIDALRSGKSIIGEAVFDPVHKARVIVIGEPIKNLDDDLLGVLIAKLSVRPINAVLAGYEKSDTNAVFLINTQGRLLTGPSISLKEKEKEDLRMDADILRRISAGPEQPTVYEGVQGIKVIGAMTLVPSLGWAVVVELDRDKAFAQVRRLQQLTVLVAVGMLALLSVCAYLLALTIVRPLKRLSAGADRVAAGDLDVDLPVLSRSEVGYLTQVFNHMVARLRQGRKELASVNAELQEKNKHLQLLSVTDPLTGLFNRNHLMETLTAEIVRSLRHKHTFALLIIDIDHFKRINDTYGHQKGDEVLHDLAEVFRKAIRDCDYAARYGGEEFMILLPETSRQGAMEVAERIRLDTGRRPIDMENEAVSVTVSIGISLFPDNGGDVKTVIQEADKALYAAKDSGRNRIMPSTSIH